MFAYIGQVDTAKHSSHFVGFFKGCAPRAKKQASGKSFSLEVFASLIHRIPIILILVAAVHAPSLAASTIPLASTHQHHRTMPSATLRSIGGGTFQPKSFITSKSM